MNINPLNKMLLSEKWEPWRERLRDKSLSCLVSLHYRFVAERFLNRIRNKKILFSPQLPLSRKFVMNKICRILGYQMTSSNKDRHELRVHWEAGTFRSRLNDTLAGRPAVNGRCRDISKRKVDGVFKKIFGYSSMIDPATFNGYCVKKSDLNYRHDGETLRCPIDDPADGFVYQRLIDNNVGGGMVMDIRLPIFKDTIPFAYLKYRPAAQRFAYRNALVEIADVGDVISKAEQEKILRFFDEMGLDWGEIDVLRDNATSALYIIDAEPISFGPPNHIRTKDYITSLITMTECFKKKIIEG